MDILLFKELTKEWPKKRRLRVEKRKNELKSNIEQTAAATEQHRETRLSPRHLSSDSSSDKPE